MTTASQFPDITLLVTHYNRSSSLERLLRSFVNIGCEFGGIVVSDDGSKTEHIEKLMALQKELHFRLITTPVNKGLGNNLNKGQDAVRTPYTLYVQEDFTPADTFPQHLKDALDMMEQDTSLDMARFYAYFRYPYLTDAGKGFGLMHFNIAKPGYRKFYAYSDHPHLRRSNFFERFGRYPEGMKGDVTEYRMMMSFLQHKGKGIFYKDFQSLFTQLNSAEEPSTMKRNFLRESRNPFMHIARELYRHLKLNTDYLFRKY
ncbi:glycosyltransferase family 2 protein [Sediminibacterium ginsengisoli]|uniref:Glycosyltransferase involved in cell wall bisynthesis n=1 Tax=Sediminibacterium ginsengisoli TaxID=413434 RepID=A0A1T4RM37_9BACT|nr:glycosyltransferase family 2 protein [Sediminibacterium ginsengisoli]SKA17054.1 Glycosyltransferase involved in cell wall bisynthesis [Sediminibacterium ginsengisoli]